MRYTFLCPNLQGSPPYRTRGTSVYDSMPELAQLGLSWERKGQQEGWQPGACHDISASSRYCHEAFNSGEQETCCWVFSMSVIPEPERAYEPPNFRMREWESKRESQEQARGRMMLHRLSLRQVQGLLPLWALHYFPNQTPAQWKINSSYTGNGRRVAGMSRSHLPQLLQHWQLTLSWARPGFVPVRFPRLHAHQCGCVRWNLFLCPF